MDEHASQTDPVTIIIGDASLLIDKLKTSDCLLKGTGDLSSVLSLPRQQPKGRPTNLSRASNVKSTSVIDYTNTSVQARPDANFSCPLCVKTFTASPLLYDHLQLCHDEQTSKFKKPRGREGKTIYHRQRTSSIPEVSPMMLQRQQEKIGIISPKQIQMKPSKLLLNPHLKHANVGTIFIGKPEDRILQQAASTRQEMVYKDMNFQYEKSQYIEQPSDLEPSANKRIKQDEAEEIIENSSVVIN